MNYFGFSLPQTNIAPLSLFGAENLDPSALHGDNSEDNVEEALKKLKRRKKIKGYRRTASYTEKVDFYIQKGRNGSGRPLQVKSTDRAVTKFEKKNPEIPAVNGQQAEEKIIKNIINKFKLW